MRLEAKEMNETFNERYTYTDDAIRNAIVATVRTQAKMAIRAIGYGSSLDAMIKQLQNRFG